MTKFNQSPKTAATTSFEGGVVYKSSHEFELYSAVATELLDDKFYESTDNRTTRLKRLISKCSPEFVMKLAIYAREEMHLRSVPLYVLMVLHTTRPDVVMHKALTRVIQRADEITEALACYDILKTHKNTSIRPVSHQIIKGVANSFEKFNEYSFAKYNRSKKITLKDALRLTHPSPKTDEQSEIYSRIAKDSLKTPYTWETELSALGTQTFDSPEQSDKAFKAKWEELIDSGKLGFMATLRNLRNMLKYNVSINHIEKVAIILESEELVKQSKQFPFRFYSAIKSIQQSNNICASRLIRALDSALKMSAANVTFFSDKESVLFACDVSGSMRTPVSERSDIEYIEVGAVLASIAQTTVKYQGTVAFATSAQSIDLRPGSPLSNIEEILKVGNSLGGGTDFQQVLHHLVQNKLQVDKVCVFTDCQVNSLGYSVPTLWAKYRAMYPASKLYVFDLSGYGQKLVVEHDKSVIHVAGWSDRIFDMVQYIENGDSAIKKILEIEL